MTHPALLIGADYGTLLHVESSLDRLAAAIGPYGFREPRRLLNLTAPQLLDELAAFVDAVGDDQPVMIAYVGHAGRGERFAYLQPSPGGGPVVGLELVEQLARLARKTRNITLLIDACHAAAVPEDPSHMTADELSAVIAAQKRELQFETTAARPLDVVVQLFAAAAPQNALEDHDRKLSSFTGPLADVLEWCAGRDVGWHEILDEVRLRMRAVDRHQAPTLAGRYPRRRPFSQVDSSHPEDLACKPLEDAIHLDGGAERGVAVGDRFALRVLGDPVDVAGPTACAVELGPRHALLSLPVGWTATDLPLRAVKVHAAAAADEHADAAPGLRRLRAACELAPRLSPGALDIRWGIVEPGGRTLVRLPPRGARIGADDPIWLAVGVRRNEHTTEPHFALLHLGPDGRLAALAPAHPQGLALPIGRHHLLASRLASDVPGADALTWPEGQPAGPHALVILASSRPLDVRALTDVGLESTQDRLAPPTDCLGLTLLEFAVE